MADLKLLKKVHLLPKLSLATRLKEYYDWEEHMEDFFWGRGLASALKMYYAEEQWLKIFYIGGIAGTKKFLVGRGAI